MPDENYFTNISATMDVAAPEAIAIRPLGQSIVHFARMTSSRRDHGILATPISESFMLTLEMKALPRTDIWLDGRHVRKPATSAGRFSLVDLSIPTTVDMNLAFDSIEMVFPKATLTALSEEEGTRGASELSQGLEESSEDIVVRSLCYSLLPAFDHPERASRLFMDHVATAMLTHLACGYGGARRPVWARGGLAPWQLRRAEELLLARMDGNVTIEALARECGLSRSHFSRSFKETTGETPHRWLMRQRIDRAQAMLLGSSMPLGEIAENCGFTDPSHFSRCFSTAVGMPPGDWRRRRRS
jgi:AraC-like DNA-binding protein